MNDLRTDEVKYCTRCQTANKKSAVVCDDCGRRFSAKYKPFYDFLKKHTIGETKDKISDTLFSCLKNFLMSHIYGLALSVALVVTATSAVYSYAPHIEKLTEEKAIAQGLIEAPAQDVPETPEEPTDPEEPEEPADPELLEGGLPVNSEIFDLFSMNKGQIDAMYGKGEFFPNFGMTYYPNNVGVSYGSLFEETFTDSSSVYSIDVPLKMLFADCPNPVTEDDIRKTFAKVTSSYSDMDETTVLSIEYKGTSILLYPEWGLSPDTGTFIKKTEDF